MGIRACYCQTSSRVARRDNPVGPRPIWRRANRVKIWRSYGSRLTRAVLVARTIRGRCGHHGTIGARRVVRQNCTPCTYLGALHAAASGRFCCRSRRQEERGPRLEFGHEPCFAACSVGSSGLDGEILTPAIAPTVLTLTRPTRWPWAVVARRAWPAGAGSERSLPG
jgi:hypothetical protein